VSFLDQPVKGVVEAQHPDATLSINNVVATWLAVHTGSAPEASPANLVRHRSTGEELN
jgi:hypothetical protein